MQEHTVKAFDEDITRLRGLIAEMGGLAEVSIEESMRALISGDEELAKVVVDRDKKIDALELEVDAMAIRIIALRAPMADDLREIIAALKIGGVMERIGDYAKNIAKRVGEIEGRKRFEPLTLIPAMAEVAAEMVHDVLTAFAARDPILAREVIERDAKVDAFYESIFRNLVSRPLSELARAAGDADLDRLAIPIELHRAPHEMDDFDILVSEMNRRRASLKHEVDALQAARDALARHRAELEIRVAERTAELCDKVAELEQRREEQARLFQDLETARNQAIQAEKLASIGQLAAGVAHEINNPVGFVLSNFGSLERYVEDMLRVLSAYEAIEPLVPAGAPQLSVLASARTAADIDYIKEDLGELVAQSRDGLDRVRRIVQDLKDFAHAGEAQWQRADLVRGIESTLNVVRNEIKYKAEVVKRCEPLPDVECVPSQLNQVFMNLLVNAAQAITDRGTITIACGTRGDEVWIEIEDTGCGMQPDVAKRIFDPFFTTKPVGQGTGLGLSVSYSIVKRHGGRIEVDSTPGQGTRFRVWMPIAQPEPELAQAA